MPIELRPNSTRPSDLDLYLYLSDGLDALAALGVKADHPKLKAPRKIAERLPAIRAAGANLWQRNPSDLIADAAQRLVRGDLTAADLPAEAVHIDAGTSKENTATARRIVDGAQGLVDNEAAAACRELGDLWITEVLRPAVQRTMEAVTPDLLDDGWTAVNMQTDDRNHPSARHLRAALEKVDDIIATLDQLADEAIMWRNYGWVPTPARPQGRWQSEDLRWLHHEKLGALTVHYRAFWLLAVRNGAEHGIWTTDEILQAAEAAEAAEPEPAGRSATGPQNLTFAAVGV